MKTAQLNQIFHNQDSLFPGKERKDDLSEKIFTSQVITREYRNEVESDSLPDLSRLLLELYNMQFQYKGEFTAIWFIPRIKESYIDVEDIAKILKHPQSRHILAENEFMKAVLIRWAPGEESTLHGHPKGGCIIKVIHGEIHEERYSSDGIYKYSENTYLRNNLAYIDDNMGYHVVSNRTSHTAVSLHFYPK